MHNKLNYISHKHVLVKDALNASSGTEKSHHPDSTAIT